MFGFFKRKPKRLTDSDLPEDVRDALMMVEVHMMEGRDPIPMLQEVAKKYPGHVLTRLNLAMLQLDRDGASVARKTYEGVLKDFPGEPGAIAGLATIEAAAGDLDEAERLAKEALAAGYQWPGCYEVVAKAQEARGELKAAAESYLAGYKLHPHGWNLLQEHCRLTDRPFVPPTEDIEPCISLDQLDDLADYVDRRANTPDENGVRPGCDHTLRFAEEWARENHVDVVELFQFLNAHGGFCDCEICLNVTELLAERDEDLEDLGATTEP